MTELSKNGFHTLVLLPEIDFLQFKVPAVAATSEGTLETHSLIETQKFFIRGIYLTALYIEPFQIGITTRFYVKWSS